MSTHNIGSYEEIGKIASKLSSNMPLICSSEIYHKCPNFISGSSKMHAVIK